MEPKIIQPEQVTEQLTDYSKTSCKYIYQLDDAVYYFSVHEEFFGELDELDFTGNQIVVLLCPSGLLTFTMEVDETTASWTFPASIEATVPTEIRKLILDSIITKNT